MKKQLDEVKRLQKIAGILKENTNEVRMWFNKDGDYVPYRPEDDTAPDYDEDEDELPPIDKDELISFIRQSGPSLSGGTEEGEYNVILFYEGGPSIPDSYMEGARDVFMCVVEACGGEATLIRESPADGEQYYTVNGCSFKTLQAVWKFLASDQIYRTYSDESVTIRQANGCASTWIIKKA